MNPSLVQTPEPKAIMFLLLLIAWWLIRRQPEDSAADDDGGTQVPSEHPHRPRPRGRGPWGPRRGPHGDPAPATPRRVRTIRARSKLRSRH